MPQTYAPKYRTHTMHPHRFRLCGPLDVCATGVNDFDAARRDLGPGPGKTGSAPSADPAAALSPRTVWKKVRCHNRSIRYTSPADMAEKRMARTKRMRWAIFIQIRRERCTHHAVMMCVCLCIRNLSDERTVFLMLALLLLPCRLLVRCCRAFHIYVACGRCSA